VKPTVKSHIALFLVNTLYAASHVVAKGVMPGFLTPNVFILLRVLGATLLFWLVKLFLPKERIARKDLLLIALCGLFGVAINQLFFFHGLSRSSSINSGIIMTINPIMVVIIAYVLLKDPVTKGKLTGIAMGTIGAVLLTVRSSQSGSEASLGDLFLFINAFSYAVYLVIAKPLMSRYSPLTVITWVFTFGSLFVLLFPPTITDLVQTSFSGFPAQIWIKIVYVVVGVTFLTYLLTMYGLKYLSPAVSSGYMYLQPVLVIVFAYVFAWMGISPDYTGAVTLEKLGYMLIIFAGVYVLSRSGEKK
jgi:drug/metabolite transporter (DMT)-like permease